jgi:hypothetical protein
VRAGEALVIEKFAEPGRGLVMWQAQPDYNGMDCSFLIG